MRSTYAFVTAASLLAILAGPAFAFHDPPGDLIASGSFSGPGSASISIDASGGVLDVELFATGSGSMGAAIALFHNGAFAGMLTLAGIAGYDGVLVDVHAGNGIDASHNTFTTPSGATAMGAAFTLSAASGDWGVVFWSAGGAQTTEWAIHASAGTTASTPVVGTNTVLATSRDFAGTANVQAFAADVGGRANLGTSLALEAEHGLVGIYYPVFTTSVNEMDASTPSGDRVCTCLFTGGGAGAYTLSLTGAGAGLSILTDVIVMAADAPVPG